MKLKLILFFMLLCFVASAQKARKSKKAKQSDEQAALAIMDSLKKRADSLILVKLRDTAQLYYNSQLQIDSLQSKLSEASTENESLKDSILLFSQEVAQLNDLIHKLEASLFKTITSSPICAGIDFYEFDYKGIPLQGVIVKDPGDIQLFHKNGKNELIRSFDKLEKLAKKQKQVLKFAMNAGMFEPGFEPVGLLITDGLPQGGINLRPKQYGNFYLLPNGIFSIDSSGVASVMETTQFHQEAPDSLRIATQSGPMLLIDGHIHPAFNRGSKNLRIRNGVGVNQAGEVIFLISKTPINFFSFAQVFQHLNCQNALYLDGSISKIYVSDLDQSTKNKGPFGPMIGVLKAANCKE